jgi:hypothetical protein
MTYLVWYQNKFGFSSREYREFKNLEDAQWFARAMQRSNYNTQIMENKDNEFFK